LKVREEKLKIIYNPLDVDRIEQLSREPISVPWEPDDQPIVLGVGRLEPVKGFPTLIDAFALVQARQDARLVVLGEGPDRAQLMSQVRGLGLESRVYMPGFVRNPFPWMRAASVFVSASRSEGCPNALMQALACGAPVVSTDCPGGAAEIL